MLYLSRVGQLLSAVLVSNQGVCDHTRPITAWIGSLFVRQDDEVFFREFGAVMLCILVFFFIALFVARSIGATAFEAARLAPGEVENRIQPIGQVAFGEAGTMAAEPEEEQTTVAMAAPKTGKEVYQTACFACHATGAAGAPILGDTAAWEPRAAQGMDTLVDHAVNGKGALMPAKGGRPDFSDEEVIAGLKYMLQESGISAN